MVGNAWWQKAHVAHRLSLALLAVALGRRPSAPPARRGNGAQGAAAGCGWRRWGPAALPEARHNERSFLKPQPSIFAGQAWGLGPLPRLALPCTVPCTKLISRHRQRLIWQSRSTVPRQFAKCDAITHHHQRDGTD